MFCLGAHFDLNDVAAYASWRDNKLRQFPAHWQALVVELGNPYELTPGELAQLKSMMGRANMVIYRSACLAQEPQLPVRVAQQMGMRHLDANWLADEDGVSHIEVSQTQADKADFIPYTSRGLLWHTDGYYHPQERTISGMVLHCVRSAVQGGFNQLVDHERVYIALRDENPHWIEALMHPQAMTIPARFQVDGEIARPAQTGPVFSILKQANGSQYLHMRYTARTRSIEWRDDVNTLAAVDRLQSLLNASLAWAFEVKLESGMGLISHNVLHTRSDFVDDPNHPRLIYRARYVDRAQPLPSLENLGIFA
jgi:hypothetical protein